MQCQEEVSDCCRPSISFTATGNSLWDASDYDLLNGGLVCPGDGTPRNVLNWADGSPAEYRIVNFSLSGPIMTFDVLGL